jgi:hypothetical protein
MEINIVVDNLSSVKLSYSQSLVEKYNFSDEEMTKKVYYDVKLLEIMLSIKDLNSIDKKILEYLYQKAKSWCGDMKIGYLILKYTDIYQKKYIPAYQ